MTKKICALGIAATLAISALTAPLQSLADETMIHITPDALATVPASVTGADQDVTLQAVKIIHAPDGSILALEPASAAELSADALRNSGTWSPIGLETIQLTASANMGYPFGSYASLGVIMGKGSCFTAYLGAGCFADGVLIEASLAQHGEMLSIGWEQRGIAVSFVGTGAISVAAKITGFRTNGNSELQEGQIYVGPQVEISAMFARLSLGFLAKIAGMQPGYNLLPTASVGFGF